MNIAYKTRQLSLEQKKDLCRRAKEKAYNWWVDTLDCRVTVLRQCVQMDFEEALDKMTNKDHFVVVWRSYTDQESYLEISFSTMGQTPEYFLWIQLKEELIPEFTKDLPRL